MTAKLISFEVSPAESSASDAYSTGGAETSGAYPETDGYRVRIEFFVDEASYESFVAWVRAQRGGNGVSAKPPRREPTALRRFGR